MSLQTFHAGIFLGNQSNLSALSVQIAPGPPLLLPSDAWQTRLSNQRLGQQPSSLRAPSKIIQVKAAAYMSLEKLYSGWMAQAAPQSLHPHLLKMIGSRQQSLLHAFGLNVSLQGLGMMRNDLPEALL